ncbi:hypothetical protein DL93DRAFT_2088232 [Clavulina sp. PMI_390]|nr:hypothetical protein DL93DRAFT_2088232 [Clavulina sp. PMI_390]
MFSGNCLCGKTTVSIPSESVNYVRSIATCHCTDCQEWSGNSCGASIFVPKRDVQLSGPLREYAYKVDSMFRLDFQLSCQDVTIDSFRSPYLLHN